MPLERLAWSLLEVNNHLGIDDIAHNPFWIVRFPINFRVKELFYKRCDKHINQYILLLLLWSKI
jgi:hypothetical protein